MQRGLDQVGVEQTSLQGMCWKWHLRFREKRLKPAVPRLTVGRVIEEHGFSQRRACRLIGIDHSTLRYQSKRPGRRATAPAAAGVGSATPPVRLSQVGLAIGSRGARDESQKTVPAVSRGQVDGASAPGS
jgi:hypothetical protein